MREHKYQAWDTELKFMYPDAFDHPDYAFADLVELEQFKVREYTGLHDNTKWEELTKQEQEAWIEKGETKDSWKGKEIYEGDILSFGQYTDGSGPCLHVVEWSDEDAAFQTRELFYIKQSGFGLDPCSKVIGNVFENPELLEVK